MTRNRYEFWYDQNHTGALRIIDHTRKMIYGSDPREKRWKVPFTTSHAGRSLQVDFGPKHTHRHHQQMEAVYRERRQVLQWPDGNKWRRVRVDPRIVLRMIA